jgi:hypothetical protein
MIKNVIVMRINHDMTDVTVRRIRNSEEKCPIEKYSVRSLISGMAKQHKYPVSHLGYKTIKPNIGIKKNIPNPIWKK